MDNLYLVKLLQEITKKSVTTTTQEKGGLGIQRQYMYLVY